jgi:hypothetical protein
MRPFLRGVGCLVGLYKSATTLLRSQEGGLLAFWQLSAEPGVRLVQCSKLRDKTH